MRDTQLISQSNMAKKRRPIFKRAWDLILSQQPFSIDKVRRPFFKNKVWRFKKVSLLNNHYHNNYAIVREYEFSPSSTPFFRLHRKKLVMLLLCGCSCNSKDIEGGALDDEWSSEVALSSFDQAMMTEEEGSICSSDGGSPSVDEKAEKFIEKFYEEMRLQRQESVLKHQESVISSVG
ncbi:hypothetical protein QJS04_geneDACA003057 [Acorus gramineus]|uniref:Cotton fiber protein n=1 Tax=Acorus gramineus TaxID=55184 RepID=A0AAV9BR98_ACOGR|nr:hypothetical protein QJS04_geneDACA003057 [Acorus gramineus]